MLLECRKNPDAKLHLSEAVLKANPFIQENRIATIGQLVVEMEKRINRGNADAVIARMDDPTAPMPTVASRNNHRGALVSIADGRAPHHPAPHGHIYALQRAEPAA